jgi:ubiquitin-conjugating enzyme E2 J1
MAQNPAIKRLERELRLLHHDPQPDFVTGPAGDNLFEWHFSIRGPRDTPFQGGIYHGKIVFPPQYPMKPPDVFFLTPNGRFQTNRAICLTTTSFHPESWKPSWDVQSMLIALIAFLPTKAEGIGSIEASDEERIELARRSRGWRCPSCSLHLPGEEGEPDQLAAHPAPDPPKEIEAEVTPEDDAAAEKSEEEAEPATEKVEDTEKFTPRKKFYPLVDIPIIFVAVLVLLLLIDIEYPFIHVLTGLGTKIPKVVPEVTDV